LHDDPTPKDFIDGALARNRKKLLALIRREVTAESLFQFDLLFVLLVLLAVFAILTKAAGIWQANFDVAESQSPMWQQPSMGSLPQSPHRQ
jgi:hypothetical protein